jgi:hypothetical protein
LKEHEEVMWSRKSGPFFGGTSLGRIFLGFGALFVGVGLFPIVNSCSTFAYCNWFTAVSAGPGLLFTGIGGLIIWENYGGRSSTDYYLTNYRLVETKAGRVVGQVPRKLFKGEPTARFLAQDSMYDLGGSPLYNVSVRDPESGDVLMRLNDMSKESVVSLAGLGGVIYCEQCGRGNTPSERTCQSCGASL